MNSCLITIIPNGADESCRQGSPLVPLPKSAQGGHLEVGISPGRLRGSNQPQPFWPHLLVDEHHIREPDFVRKNLHGGDPFEVGGVPGEAVIYPGLGSRKRKGMGEIQEAGTEQGQEGPVPGVPWGLEPHDSSTPS